jgi:hypothetical protein
MTKKLAPASRTAGGYSYISGTTVAAGMKNQSRGVFDQQTAQAVQRPLRAGACGHRKRRAHYLSAQMKALATPMFASLEKGGREIIRVTGIQSTQDFILYNRFVSGWVSQGNYQ